MYILRQVYYHNQDRWAFTFQNCAVLSRHKLIEDTVAKTSPNHPGPHIYITERCLYTDYHVFVKMLRDDNKLSAIEFSLYERWFQEVEKNCTPLSGIVYVDTCPTTCVDRIKGRSRDGEEGIPLTYLEKLDEFQSRWLNDIKVPIVRTCTVEGVERFVNEMLQKEY